MCSVNAYVFNLSQNIFSNKWSRKEKNMEIFPIFVIDKCYIFPKWFLITKSSPFGLTFFSIESRSWTVSGISSLNVVLCLMNIKVSILNWPRSDFCLFWGAVSRNGNSNNDHARLKTWKTIFYIFTNPYINISNALVSWKWQFNDEFRTLATVSNIEVRRPVT